VIPKNPNGIALMAGVYSDSNLGIRSRRQVGALMVIDIDEPDTKERIEREYGPLPLTYTTQTRPVSRPYKQHIYFLQTEYSVATFHKQITDLTHLIGYDLKCNGGWGYVAAEGSVRGGEIITALHNVPMIPIPDSLVDFLRHDIHKNRLRKKPAASTHTIPMQSTPPPLATIQPKNYVVPRGDRSYVIRSRIGTFKAAGMTDDEVFTILSAHIRDYFQDPDDWLSKEGRRKLKALIKQTPSLGAQSYVNLLHHRRNKRKPKPSQPTPVTTMRERFKNCPDEITIVAAREYFSIKTAAEEQRLWREFKRNGYVADGSQGAKTRTWIRRRAELSESVAHLHFLSLPDSAFHSDAAVQIYTDHLLHTDSRSCSCSCSEASRSGAPHNKSVKVALTRAHVQRDFLTIRAKKRGKR
jgi:Bifunctional DNA primase/polymerase, N-terminal